MSFNFRDAVIFHVLQNYLHFLEMLDLFKNSVTTHLFTKINFHQRFSLFFRVTTDLNPVLFRG